MATSDGPELGKLWHPTTAIRWLRRDGELVLQQKWQNSSGAATRWMDVHVETEHTEKVATQ